MAINKANKSGAISPDFVGQERKTEALPLLSCEHSFQRSCTVSWAFCSKLPLAFVHSMDLEALKLNWKLFEFIVLLEDSEKLSCWVGNEVLTNVIRKLKQI